MGKSPEKSERFVGSVWWVSGLLGLLLAGDASQWGRVGVQPRGGDGNAAVDAQAVAAVGDAFECVVNGHQLGGLALFQCKGQVTLGLSGGPVVARGLARFGGRFGDR